MSAVNVTNTNLPVTISSNQQFTNVSDLRVQSSRSSFPWKGQLTTNVDDPTAFANNINIINPDFQSCASLLGGNDDIAFQWNGALNAYLPLAAATHVIFSSSADDSSTGPGARNMMIYYYASPTSTTISTQMVTMNGTTAVSLGSLFRVAFVQIITYGSGDRYNRGDIRITSSALIIPGVIKQGRIKWVSGHLYVPPITSSGSTNGTKYYGSQVFFDYLNVSVENQGADEEIIYLVAVQNQVTQILQSFHSNSDQYYSLPLYNASLPLNPLVGTDILLVMTRFTNTGQFYGSFGIGMHIE